MGVRPRGGGECEGLTGCREAKPNSGNFSNWRKLLSGRIAAEGTQGPRYFDAPVDIDSGYRTAGSVEPGQSTAIPS